jgi:hypothetical protein
MTREESEPAGRARLSDVLQAHAWLETVNPGEYARRDRDLLIADLGDDDETYTRLERELVAQWRAHRDDPLSPPVRQAAKLAQSMAWLGSPRDQDWRHAHALALTDTERNRDRAWLFGAWRLHRDEGKAPEYMGNAVGTLLRGRLARLEQATAWHRARDPERHRQWAQRRDFADTVADAWADDHDLLTQWRAHATRAARPRPMTADNPWTPAREGGRPAGPPPPGM